MATECLRRKLRSDPVTNKSLTFNIVYASELCSHWRWSLLRHCTNLTAENHFLFIITPWPAPSDLTSLCANPSGRGGGTSLRRDFFEVTLNNLIGPTSPIGVFTAAVDVAHSSYK